MIIAIRMLERLVLRHTQAAILIKVHGKHRLTAGHTADHQTTLKA